MASSRVASRPSGKNTPPCTTALHRVICDILYGIDENDSTAIWFIDLQKCFDTIDHTIILKKLQKCMGLGVQPTSGFEAIWFRDLSSRKQGVKLNGLISSFVEIVMSIPQGSILGPILFVLFINDLPNCINKCQCKMFADDTIIYSQSPTLDGVRSYLHVLNYVDKLISWLDMNKLDVNVSKSSCMVLSTCKKLGHGIYMLRKLKDTVPINKLTTIYKPINNTTPHWLLSHEVGLC